MKKVIETALAKEEIDFLTVSPDAIYVPSMGVVVTCHPVKDVTVETESGLKFSVAPSSPAKAPKKPKPVSKPRASKVQAQSQPPALKKEASPRPKPSQKEPTVKTVDPLEPGDALNLFLRTLTRVQIWSAIELITGQEVKQAIPDLVVPCQTHELISGFIKMLKTTGYLEHEEAIIAKIKQDLAEGKK